MPPTNGIVHAAGSPGNREYLVLEEVKAKVMIIDVAARVTLIQKYRNPLNTATSRALYYFPVPASGAVCAFEMKTSDDRVVIAEKAREEYEKALSQGQETSLLEWVADDVFTISVGSIPANSTVSTKLVYTMTLPNDDNADEIRLQLPCCVGERYGPPLTALDGAAAPSSSTPIRITTDIQTSGRIKSITSPSHADNVSETRYPTHLGRPSRRRSTVQFQSSTFLDRDFILVIRADGLDESRCFAELHRDPEGIRSDTVAMQLTIVPNFQLPPVKGQEYIFLVDRSGSMSGARIETAKRTLELLLRMLPYAETKFNIFSFGTHNDSLWTASQTYNQNSVTAATAHVTSMSADYGGTETTVPKEVTLRGHLEGGGPSFELTVPIRSIQLTESEPGLPMVHSLAAWRLIQDHQEGTASLALAVGDASEDEIRKASIVRLGERYQVASRHTSFVAVDSGSDARRRRARRTYSPTRARSDSPSPVSPLQAWAWARPSGAWRDSGDFSVVEDRDEDEGYNSAATFSTLSSLEGSYDSDWSDGSIDPPPVSEEDARMQRSPSPKLEPLRLAPSTIREERRRRIQQAPPQPRAPPPPVHPEVVRLAAMQLFDGSFDNSIRGVVGDVILNEADVLQVDRAMWATAVSIAFTSKHLADPAQKDLLDDLLQKASLSRPTLYIVLTFVERHMIFWAASTMRWRKD
ncbi:hypothetical protein B0H14DRAFT_3870521 [Mycena olivaceomarginata]|nr:hypothetical protein B0H14DRAFT_3870521 [Mycena olivaceomarginata]